MTADWNWKATPGLKTEFDADYIGLSDLEREPADEPRRVRPSRCPECYGLGQHSDGCPAREEDEE
jgi:hypothetical protein